MEKHTVKKGFGYYKDSKGNIIAKAMLKKGEHDLSPGHTYVEVNNQKEYDEIIVRAENILSEDQKINLLIKEKLIRIAEDALIADGVISRNANGMLKLTGK